MTDSCGRSVCVFVGAAVLHTLSASAILPPAQTGNFYVSDFNNDRIVTYDASGSHLGSFTAPGLDGPRGIVVLPDGRIHVASQQTDEVFVFTADEAFDAKFGHPQLDGPTGMAIHDDDLL